MILSNKDIAELANDNNQPRLVRYLATRVINMHKRIAFDNERIDALAGALTHISCVSRNKLDAEARRWKERVELGDDVMDDDEDED